MIIIDMSNEKNLDRSLKKLKRKFENSGTLRELRNRKEYIKPSIKRRNEIKKAIYLEKKKNDED